VRRRFEREVSRFSRLVQLDVGFWGVEQAEETDRAVGEEPMTAAMDRISAPDYTFPLVT